MQFSNDVRVEVALAPLELEALRKTTRDMVGRRVPDAGACGGCLRRVLVPAALVLA